MIVWEEPGTHWNVRGAVYVVPSTLMDSPGGFVTTVTSADACRIARELPLAVVTIPLPAGLTATALDSVIEVEVEAVLPSRATAATATVPLGMGVPFIP